VAWKQTYQDTIDHIYKTQAKVNKVDIPPCKSYPQRNGFPEIPQDISSSKFCPSLGEIPGI
jgi:hypothetical protein